MSVSSDGSGRTRNELGWTSLSSSEQAAANAANSELQASLARTRRRRDLQVVSARRHGTVERKVSECGEFATLDYGGGVRRVVAVRRRPSSDGYDLAQTMHRRCALVSQRRTGSSGRPGGHSTSSGSRGSPLDDDGPGDPDPPGPDVGAVR